MLGWVGTVTAAIAVALVLLTTLTHPTSGHVGETLDGISIQGQSVTVRLSSFTDPAADQDGDSCGGGSGNTCGPSDDHYATATFQVTNVSNSSLPSTLDMGVVGYNPR